MAENEPLTPEKQLLKLIENPKPEALRVENVKREGKKWFSLRAFEGRLAFWKTFSNQKWFSFRQLTGTSFGVRQVNLILKCSILFLSLYVGYAVVEMGMELRRASNLIFQPDKVLPLLLDQGIELKNVSYYLEKVAARNIFRIPEASKPKAEETAPLPATESDHMKDFSLVGISWSADPEAMIEDTKNKRTYFVKRGQSIDPSVKVVTVFKDRVILNYEGKEFELR